MRRPDKHTTSWPAPPHGVRPVNDAWLWRNAVLALEGPPEAGTRYVLLVMSSYMNSDGSGCFAGVRAIAERSRLNKDTVMRHRNAAVTLGYLIPPTTRRRATRQLWLPCLPPLTASLSEPVGHHKAVAVRTNTRHCPNGSDLPTPTSLRGFGDKGRELLMAANEHGF